MVNATNKGTSKADSQLARKALDTLKSFGVSATYAQCLELMARLGGARTLHVKQASLMDESVQKVAMRQASALMFKSLGRYGALAAPKVVGAISEAFALEATEGSRAVEQAMCVIFEENGVELKAPYDLVVPEELPNLFWRLFQDLQDSLQKKATQEQGSLDLFKGLVQDWTVAEGTAENAQELSTYALSVTKNETAVFVDMAKAGASPQDADDSLHAEIAVIVEVNDGVPCVHVANSVYGDVLLSLFSTQEGLLIEPGHSTSRIQPGWGTSALGFDKAPGEVSLAKLNEMRTKNVRMSNCMFLKAPSYTQD